MNNTDYEQILIKLNNIEQLIGQLPDEIISLAVEIAAKILNPPQNLRDTLNPSNGFECSFGVDCDKPVPNFISPPQNQCAAPASPVLPLVWR